jgi:hypothetical protein
LLQHAHPHLYYPVLDHLLCGWQHQVFGFAPIKPEITNASDALWSAAVERERVIAALVAAPQVSRSVVEEAAQELELSRKSSIV